MKPRQTSIGSIKMDDNPGELSSARNSLKAWRKKILLVLSGRENELRSLQYALNIASRIERTIEVLTFMPINATREVVAGELASRAMDISQLMVHEASGCIKSAIFSHMHSRNDIDFVVIESESILESKCKGRQSDIKEISFNLQCPLVVVSKIKTTE